MKTSEIGGRKILESFIGSDNEKVNLGPNKELYKRIEEVVGRMKKRKLQLYGY